MDKVCEDTLETAKPSGDGEHKRFISDLNKIVWNPHLVIFVYLAQWKKPKEMAKIYREIGWMFTSSSEQLKL